MTEVKATSKYLRGSAQKARIVTNAIQGMPALEALDELKYMQKKAAGHVYKTLHSAIANAVENNGLKDSDLVILKAYANEAPTFKRGRAESKGRSRLIMKRNSHITIILGLKSEQKQAEADK